MATTLDQLKKTLDAGSPRKDARIERAINMLAAHYPTSLTGHRLFGELATELEAQYPKEWPKMRQRFLKLAGLSS